MNVTIGLRELSFVVIVLSSCQNDGIGTRSTENISDETVELFDGLISKIQNGEPVFGAFARPQTADGGSIAGRNKDPDFIFYSLESGPWDIPGLGAFRQAMINASEAVGGHPITLRIPPIREDRQALYRYIDEGLVEGVEGIVFPHVESAEEAELAVQALGLRSWPLNPMGDVISVILIEDRVGVESAEEIVGTPGVSVVIPGPGDLRRAYEGDEEAIEAAIQRVLAACMKLGVPCGITAGVEDVADRLEQGFKMIIVSDPATIGIGRGSVGQPSF